MTRSAVRQGEAGELLLSGVLDHRTGRALRKRGQALINASNASVLLIDCSAVVKSSSVGLSLLLCFLRDAAAVNKPASIRALPGDMREIAQVSGLTELLAHP